MAKILLVEDDSLLTKLYVNMLGNAGHEVVVAGDGEEAFTKAKTLAPNLILMDIMMPKMNGLQSLDVLKKDPTTAKVPVVVMTALKQVNSEQDVINRGAVAFIDKAEHDPKEVVALMNNLLSQGVPAASNAAQPEATQPQVTQAQPAASQQPQPQQPQPQQAVGEVPRE